MPTIYKISDVNTIPSTLYECNTYSIPESAKPFHWEIGIDSIEGLLTVYEKNELEYVNYYKDIFSGYRKLGHYIKHPIVERYYAVYASPSEPSFLTVEMNDVFDYFHPAIITHSMNKKLFKKEKKLPKGLNAENYFRSLDRIEGDDEEKLYWNLYEE